MHDPRVQLDPQLAQVPWSSEFAPRSLETLFVFLRDGQPILLRPIHAESLLLGWGAGAQPGAVVAEAAARYGLHPIVVHSTSWRTLDERLVLTYLAVVEAPEHPGPHLIEVPVLRTDLARGERLAAPAHIDLDAVIEHAFRHLRWLLDDDEIVREALPDWPAALDSCRPEPFRAFAPDVGS